MGIIIPSRKGITNFYLNGDANQTASEVDVSSYSKYLSGASEAVNYGTKVCFFSDTYMYIFENGKWTNGPNLPIRWNPTAYVAEQTTAVGGRFIACDKGVAFVGCDVIEETANLWNGSTWTELPNLKVPQASNCGVFYNGKLYALGSSDEGYATRQYTYDTTSGTEWNWSATLPFKARFSDAVVYNNAIHVFGGRVSTYADDNTNHYVYDGTSWTQSTNIPDTFSTYLCGRAIVHDNKIYLLGCNGGTKTWIWDTDHWVAGKDMLITMKNEVVFTYDNEIYRLGSTASTYREKFISYEHEILGYKMTT